MALVDWEAVVADFEAFLVSDGRSSHGTDFLARKLVELRARHRIDESSDRATIRRFTERLTEVFFSLTPVATDDPLAGGDRSVSRGTGDTVDDGRRREPTDEAVGGTHDGSQHREPELAHVHP
jgi:hypothetical protein